jgi:hypothetical protein
MENQQQDKLWNYIHKLEHLLIKQAENQIKYKKQIKNKLKK